MGWPEGPPGRPRHRRAADADPAGHRAGGGRVTTLSEASRRRFPARRSPISASRSGCTGRRTGSSGCTPTTGSAGPGPGACTGWAGCSSGWSSTSIHRWARRLNGCCRSISRAPDRSRVRASTTRSQRPPTSSPGTFRNIRRETSSARAGCSTHSWPPCCRNPISRPSSRDGACTGTPSRVTRTSSSSSSTSEDPVDPETLPRDTTLRRAIAEGLAAGRHWSVVQGRLPQPEGACRCLRLPTCPCSPPCCRDSPAPACRFGWPIACGRDSAASASLRRTWSRARSCGR